MRALLKFALALCVAQASFAQTPASAPRGIDAIKPFRPFLLVNENRSVCDPFLKAWTKVFDSNERLSEEKVDLRAAYPGAALKVFDSFYENPQSMPIDFDGDGESEVLFFAPNDYSWRYSGPSLYIFDSSMDYADVVGTAGDKAHFWGSELSHAKKNNPSAPYRELVDLGSIAAAPILQVGKRIFTSTQVGVAQDGASDISLLHLNAPDGVRTMCTVVVEPSYATLAPVRATSRLLAGASGVYGQDKGPCWGTLGWTAAPQDEVLSAAIYRPWAVEALSTDSGSMHATPPDSADAARELRYLVWGASDPQSWATYLDIKRGRPQFLADLTGFYKARFGMTPEKAARYAERSWRGVLDGLIYARNPDGASLVNVAIRKGARLPITPETSPYDAVRIAVDAWLKPPPTPPGRYENTFDENIWADALVLAVRVRLPNETIDAIMEGFRARKENSWHYTDDRGTALLAALGDDVLTMKLLDFGASANAETNDFKKTPLMYAAQSDQIGAVRLLLSKGANANAATNDEKACPKLDRDHRTALMYAAENASPPVIDALLKAGADISAKDTQDNTAAWYFGRNTKITDPADRARLQRALGG